jgi:hypothetical protein
MASSTSALATSTSTPQIALPTVPGFGGKPTWLNVATGEVSVRP